MVHFQNTGSWMAENITVIDTLDDNLNWNTLRPVFMSAKCQVTLTQAGTKHIAKFVFNNINLPAKMFDEIRSNGMFTYTVHLNRGLAVGTQIKNNASIYFDYNEPVKTNTTLNTIGTVDPYVGVTPVAPVAAGFSVYPNPAGSNASAVINSITDGPATIEMTDVTGRIINTKTVSLHKGKQTVQLDINNLASGTYFVSCRGNGKTQTQKLVIIK
jgi:hypothetical protein